MSSRTKWEHCTFDGDDFTIAYRVEYELAQFLNFARLYRMKSGASICGKRCCVKVTKGFDADYRVDGGQCVT
jgi:hypothetical protein